MEINDKAPDFHTTDENGKEVALKDFRGKTVVLYFYPKADTPGCTKEACGFRDTYKKIEKTGAVLAGISAEKISGQIQPALHAARGRGQNDREAIWRREREEHVWPEGDGHRADHIRDRTRRQDPTHFQQREARRARGRGAGISEKQKVRRQIAGVKWK
jgi:hypothetical protein